MVTDIINKIKTWKFTFNNSPNDEKKKKQPKSSCVCWATQFKNVIKLNKKERKLAPNTAITYCRPPTLGNHLTNYRSIAEQQTTSSANRGSHPCNKCGLCGNYGFLLNMVLDTDSIKLPNGKLIQIRTAITCKDKEIYAARCIECHQYYVGQTNNSFATRWNSHRSNWRKMIAADEITKVARDVLWKDQNALFMHYKKRHSCKLQNELLLSDAYQVIFVEKTKANNLNIRENHWISKLDANINISRTYLPKHK